jgi:hypothetical protein
MALYRKKPVVIEAVEWDGTPDALDAIHAMSLAGNRPLHEDGGGLIIGTLEGDMRANLGDYIIKGVKGELYPCKPDIFAATYEPVAPVAGGEGTT